MRSRACSTSTATRRPSGPAPAPTLPPSGAERPTGGIDVDVDVDADADRGLAAQASADAGAARRRGSRRRRRAIRARSRRRRRPRSRTCSPTRSMPICSGSADRSADAKVDDRDRLEFADARFDSDLFAENSSADEDDSTESPASGAADLPLESADAAARLPAPRRAQGALAQRPGARSRSASSARSPRWCWLLQVGASLPRHRRRPLARAARPMLAAWCELADCSLEAPRRIDDVIVDSTALTRAIGPTPSSCRSRCATAAAAARAAVGRPEPDRRNGAPGRAPRPGAARLRRRRACIAAAAPRRRCSCMLDAGSARVSGYTVEIFYP